LWWSKRRWRCRERRCEVRTWTETSPAVSTKAVMTRRVGMEACRQVGELARSVASVAREFAVCWWTVMNSVIEHGAPSSTIFTGSARCPSSARTRQVQQETLGHRGRRDDPLYKVRKSCLAGAERTSPPSVRSWAAHTSSLASSTSRRPAGRDPRGPPTGEPPQAERSARVAPRPGPEPLRCTSLNYPTIAHRALSHGQSRAPRETR